MPGRNLVPAGVLHAGAPYGSAFSGASICLAANPLDTAAFLTRMAG